MRMLRLTNEALEGTKIQLVILKRNLKRMRKRLYLRIAKLGKSYQI